MAIHIDLHLHARQIGPLPSTCSYQYVSMAGRRRQEALRVYLSILILRVRLVIKQEIDLSSWSIMVGEGFSDSGRECTVDVRRNPNRSSCRIEAPSSSSSLEGMELEAARTLASFSHTALRAIHGTRSRKRFKNGSVAKAWHKSSQGMGTCLADNDAQDENAFNNKFKGVINVDQNPKSGGDCFMNFASCSRCRIRQNLTEVERDARRMHRVLSNRESAPKTIRRRQALQDELSNKVTDLSLDNQKMKMEREMVMKEYHTLKNKNKQLRDEVSKKWNLALIIALISAILSQ